MCLLIDFDINILKIVLIMNFNKRIYKKFYT